MLAKVYSATHIGLETVLLEVEVNIFSKGFPSFSIIGLPDKAVEEAKERVKTALTNTGIDFPQSKIVVNLAPADLPKEGSLYDLPIAVGILVCMGIVKLPEDKSFFYGELSLDGTLRHTKGVFLLATSAKNLKVVNLFVPKLSAQEAAVIRSVNTYPVLSLIDLIKHLNGSFTIPVLQKILIEHEIEGNLPAQFDFNEIVGQQQAKRALIIAAAGGHNVFMQGPPGSGKTMLARAMAGILPPLTEEESLEVTKIYSLTGNISPGTALIYSRPFRVVHHTTSRIGLIGGGSNPHPGEISLSHCGVLFLDEFPEFGRSTLEALRQPMEDGVVTVSRAAGSFTFPAQFSLVAAANPCPCGFLGDPKKECKCSPRMISRYASKLSGPLMDRIDLHISVPAVDVDKLIASSKSHIKGESSSLIRERVKNARKIQSRRFKDQSVFVNANMKNKHIGEFCKMTDDASIILKQAVNSYNLSARTYFRLIKVSRTIADLENEENIKMEHVAEALQYRIRSVE